MNWEALVVIGFFTLALGVLLFVPAWLWVRHKRRIEPEKYPKLRLTRIGWALICATVLFLIGGFVVDFIAPESLLGQLVKTSRGRFIYLAVVVFIFWVIEIALKARGVRLIEEDQGKTNQ